MCEWKIKILGGLLLFFSSPQEGVFIPSQPKNLLDFNACHTLAGLRISDRQRRTPSGGALGHINLGMIPLDLGFQLQRGLALRNLDVFLGVKNE